MMNIKNLKYFDVNKVNASSLLLRFNMKWHAQIMKDTLIRYKILLFFFAAIISPSFSSLINMISGPVKSLIVTHSSVASISLSLLIYQFLGLIWMAIHQLVFSKQPWEKYLISLPITDNQKIYSDIVMLLLSNLLIWFPLGLASAIECVKSYPNFLAILLLIEKCLLNLLLIMLAQLCWIKRKYLLFISVILIDSIVIYQTLVHSIFLQSIITLILTLIALIQLSNCYYNQNKMHLKKINTNLGNRSECETNYIKIMPFVRIQVKNMFVDNYAQSSMTAIVILLTTIFSLLILTYGKDSPILLLILLTLIFINSFTISNLYLKLYVKRKMYSYYLFSLPITRIRFFKDDLFILGSILLFSNAMILIFSIYTGLISQINKISIAILGSIVFLIVSYFPQIKFKHHGQFITLALMFMFIITTYFFIIF